MIFNQVKSLIIMSILVCGVCMIPIDSKDEKPMMQDNELQGTYEDLSSLLSDHLYESPKKFYFDDGLDESYLANLANDEDEEDLSDNEHLMSKKSAAPRRIFIGIYKKQIDFLSWNEILQVLYYTLIFNSF